MSDQKNIDGHLYPVFHPGWGGFAEELFHYTSRYYAATEAFLRNLAADRGFRMSGYKAAHLSSRQREVMAVILAVSPDKRAGEALISIVRAVTQGRPDVGPEVAEFYLRQQTRQPEDIPLVSGVPPRGRVPEAVSPLDPFLSMAERLQIPVAVCEHHVEICMRTLAEQLDSPNSRIRSNLQEAVIQLHNSGYMLKNHPHLTHSEAHMIADEDAV